jgi:hypothetical protein
MLLGVHSEFEAIVEGLRAFASVFLTDFRTDLRPRVWTTAAIPQNETTTATRNGVWKTENENENVENGSVPIFVTFGLSKFRMNHLKFFPGNRNGDVRQR